MTYCNVCFSEGIKRDSSAASSTIESSEEKSREDKAKEEFDDDFLYIKDGDKLIYGKPIYTIQVVAAENQSAESLKTAAVGQKEVIDHGEDTGDRIQLRSVKSKTDVKTVANTTAEDLSAKENVNTVTRYVRVPYYI